MRSRHGLVVAIDDLIGHPERRREFSGEIDVSLRLGDALIRAPLQVSGTLTGTVEGVVAFYQASSQAVLACSRCLREWTENLEVEGKQHFARVPDEDGYAIEGGTVDMAGPATDEISLAIPAAPLCSPDCKGLCPTCGTDLNEDPCEGHGEESDSPFAALRQLFEP
jgi:uncharacterized protein